jgi:hypothetical protein
VKYEWFFGMADTLTTITKIINSPPGVLVAGGVLAGIVWKFFERVEAVLTDQTKLEVAVWLLDRKKLSSTFQSWPDTFANVFDCIFGKRHLSWRCFWRSCVASYGLLFSILFIYTQIFLSRYQISKTALEKVPPPPTNPLIGNLQPRWFWSVALVFGMTLLTNVVPDYVSLLESRVLLRLMTRFRFGLMWSAAILLDGWMTLFIGFLPVEILSFALTWKQQPHSFLAIQVHSFRHPVAFARSVYQYALLNPIVVFPAFFTSIWLWLYAGSGLILKAARRFDIGFGWFISKADIEKRPLSSIGLVAGALVAIVYWTAVIVSKVVG